MMTIHVVMVHHPNGRYADSYWIKKEHAEERKEFLTEHLSNGSLGTGTSWRIYVSNAALQDGAAAE